MYRVLATCLLFALGLGLVQAAPLRQWEDQLGQQLQAAFIGLVQGECWLRRPDGTLLKLPPEQLSDADLAHLAQLAQVAQAERAAGYRVSSWDVAEGDRASAEVLQALCQAPLERLSLSRMEPAKALQEIVERVRVGRDLPLRFDIELRASLPGGRFRLTLPEGPAFQAIAQLSRASGLCYRLEDGVVVLESRLLN